MDNMEELSSGFSNMSIDDEETRINTDNQSGSENGQWVGQSVNSPYTNLNQDKDGANQPTLRLRLKCQPRNSEEGLQRTSRESTPCKILIEFDEQKDEITDMEENKNLISTAKPSHEIRNPQQVDVDRGNQGAVTTSIYPTLINQFISFNLDQLKNANDKYVEEIPIINIQKEQSQTEFFGQYGRDPLNVIDGLQSEENKTYSGHASIRITNQGAKAVDHAGTSKSLYTNTKSESADAIHKVTTHQSYSKQRIFPGTGDIDNLTESSNSQPNMHNQNSTYIQHDSEISNYRHQNVDEMNSREQDIKNRNLHQTFKYTTHSHQKMQQPNYNPTNDEQLPYFIPTSETFKETTDQEITISTSSIRGDETSVELPSTSGRSNATGNNPSRNEPPYVPQDKSKSYKDAAVQGNVRSTWSGNATSAIDNNQIEKSSKPTEGRGSKLTKTRETNDYISKDIEPNQEQDEEQKAVCRKQDGTHLSKTDNKNETGARPKEKQQKAPCFLCGLLIARLHCDKCFDGTVFFCEECFKIYHQHPNRKKHTLTAAKSYKAPVNRGGLGTENRRYNQSDVQFQEKAMNFEKVGNKSQPYHQEQWQCKHCTSWNGWGHYVCRICGKSNDNLRPTIPAKRYDENDFEEKEEDNHSDKWQCQYCTSWNAVLMYRCTVCFKTNDDLYELHKHQQALDDDDDDDVYKSLPANNTRAVGKTIRPVASNIDVNYETSNHPVINYQAAIADKTQIGKANKKQNTPTTAETQGYNLRSKELPQVAEVKSQQLILNDEEKTIYRRLQATGVQPNREKAKIAAKLIAMGYDEKDAINASKKSNEFEKAHEEVERLKGWFSSISSAISRLSRPLPSKNDKGDYREIVQKKVWQCTNCNSRNDDDDYLCRKCNRPRYNQRQSTPAKECDAKYYKNKAEDNHSNEWQCEYCTSWNNLFIYWCRVCSKTNDKLYDLHQQQQERQGPLKDAWHVVKN